LHCCGWCSGGIAAAVIGKAPWPCLIAENDIGKAAIQWWNNKPVATDISASVAKAVTSTVTAIFKE